VSGRISGGKRRVFTGVVILALVVVNFMFPVAFMWWWAALGVFVLFNLGWDTWVDWVRLRRDSFFFADFTAANVLPGDKRYSLIVMPRAYPPRLLWALVVNDHSTRIYMGWLVWSRNTPGYEKAVSPGVRRKQVA
jgi:hypothetical protein